MTTPPPTEALSRDDLINAIDSPTVAALANIFNPRSNAGLAKSYSEEIVDVLAPRLVRSVAQLSQPRALCRCGHRHEAHGAADGGCFKCTCAGFDWSPINGTLPISEPVAYVPLSKAEADKGEPIWREVFAAKWREKDVWRGFDLKALYFHPASAAPAEVGAEAPQVWEQIGRLRDYDQDGEEITEICSEGDPGAYVVYRGMPPSPSGQKGLIEFSDEAIRAERLLKLVRWCKPRLKHERHQLYLDLCLSDLSKLDPDPEMQEKLVQSSPPSPADMEGK